jgi:hypothetical protein
MDSIFYNDWLLVGDPEHQYTGSYQSVKLAGSDSVKRSSALKLQPGHYCRYANRLRNNNSYQDFKLKGQAKYSSKKVAASKVIAFYTCGQSLLVQNYDSWALFVPETLSQHAEGEWYENGSTFFSDDSRFFTVHRKLDEISSTGKLLSRTRGMSASDRRFHEVASFGDRTIISGYQTHPDLPEPIDPFGFLESIPKDGFTDPNPKTNQRKIEKSYMISYFEEYTIIPVYLEDKIVQPFSGRIAIFDYEMKVIRVIEGEFIPYFVSAGIDSILYMSGIAKNSQKLYAFDVEGHLIFETEVPKGLGESISPPLVSTSNELYWVGTRGIAAFDETGKVLWTHKLIRSMKSSVYPLLYNDVLTVCFDSECKALNKKGEIIFSLSSIEGGITTPLISHGKDDYFFGTSSGVYKINRLE